MTKVIVSDITHSVSVQEAVYKVQIASGASDIQIISVGEGNSLVSSTAGVVTSLKTISAGDNVTLSDDGETITVSALEDDLSNNTTDDLAEGSNNLYYTDERVDDRVDTLLQAGNGIALDYNDTDGELTITSDLMEETVKNATGATLLKGTPVYVTGVAGNKPTVAAADASSASHMPAIGILNEDIANDAEGSMLIMGRISGVDTSAFSEGDTIYVAEGGGYTNTRPTATTSLVQNLGFVTKVHATNGGGIVYGSGRSNDIPNAVSRHLIPDTDNTYDLGSETSKWRSLYLSGGSLYIEGQKVVGSTDGSIDFTTDDNENMTIFAGGSGTEGTMTIGSAGLVTTLQDQTINLGPTGGSGQTNIRNILEASTFHNGPLELTGTLIEQTTANQNLEIRTNGTGYLHANVADLYVGPLSGAVKIDESSISATAGTLTVTGNLTGDVTGDLVAATTTAKHIVPNTDGSYELGASGNGWDDVWVGANTRIRNGIFETVSGDASLTFEAHGTGELIFRGNQTTFGDDSDPSKYLTIQGLTGTIQVEGNDQIQINDNLWARRDFRVFDDTLLEGNLQVDVNTTMSGTLQVDDNATVDGLLKVNDGFTLGTFNPYAAYGGTAMPTSIMGVGQQSGWSGVTVRSRGEHAWGLTGLGIPNEAPRALSILQAGRLDSGSDEYLNSGDTFGQFMVNPYSGYRTGTEWLTPSASLDFEATENHSSSGMGTKLVIKTTSNGSFAGATDSAHTDGEITIQGTTLSTNGTLNINDSVDITGTLAVDDVVTVTGSTSTKNSVIGDFQYGGNYDFTGLRVNAGDTAWPGIVFSEYEGGADKPLNAFTNAGFQTEIYGGTPTNQQPLNSGKRLIAINGTAANSTSGIPATSNLRILGTTTETQSSTNRGAQWEFHTTPTGESGSQTTMFLRDGNTIQIGNSTYENGEGYIGAAGGNLKIQSPFDTNGNDIVNTNGNVKVNDNLDVTGDLDVTGSLTVDGGATIGNDNTADFVQINARVDMNGLFGLINVDTATAQYYASLENQGFITINAGSIIYVTDGDSGNPCLGVYNGTSWKRVALGSDISSS